MIDPQSLCDLDAERAVLGAALLDELAADACLPILPPAAMGREQHRRTWAAIGRLRAKRRACDPLTVGDALQEAGDLDEVSGAVFLADLIAEVPTTANAVAYAEIVRDAWARRQALRKAKRIAALAGDLTVPLDEIRSAISDCQRSVADAEASGRNGHTLDALALEAWQWVESLYDHTEQPGMATGIRTVDGWLGGGLHAGELAILGGRPSVGKSALAQQWAENVASDGGRVLFASAEMDGRTVGLRSLSHAASVDSRRLRGSPPMEDEDWRRMAPALTEISDYGSRVTVVHHQGMDAIASEARRLHAQEPLALLVVDHLQHLRSPRGTENRNQAIGGMAAECKALAVQCGCAVLALSQLNRSAPGQDRRPRLHDLRESGELEQLADTVLLLHRDRDESPPPQVEVELIVAKQRNGETGTLRLLHHRPTGRFREGAAGR